ncbi:MAG: c-type cytochrome domain-containing protein [Vicinamibacterales bacterium]
MSARANACLRAGACLLIGGGFVLVPFRFASGPGESSRWLLFTGGFHPLVLHLPIGILIALAAFEAWGVAHQKNEPVLRHFLWLVVAVSASVAVATGYALAQGGGHDPDLLQPHLWLASGFTALCWLSLGTLQLKDVPVVRFSAWAIAALPMIAAGHFGGVMVHGSPFANAPWRPDPAALEILPPLGETIEVYADLVHPILATKCQRCHGPGRQNSRLRLDSLGAALAGGSHGPAVFPGRAKESRLIQAVLLPVENDKHMPPKSMPQLNQAEIDLLHWWIEGGASGETRVAAKEAPAVITPFLVPGYRLLPDPQLVARQESEDKRKLEQQAQRRATLEGSLAKLPAPYRDWFHFTGQSSADLEFVVATSPTAFGNEQLAMVGALLRECIRITLADTQVTDDGLVALGLSSAVRELNLRRTPVTNRGLQALAGASGLELLNIYGTAVDDGLAEQSPPLPSLRRLFVGDTRVSTETVAQLRSKYPRAEIVGSLSVPVEIARSTPPTASRNSNP